MDDRAAVRQQKKLEREQKRQARIEAGEARLAKIRAQNEERKAAEAQKREDRANAAVARARELRADPETRAKIDARLASREENEQTVAAIKQRRADKKTAKKLEAKFEGHEIRDGEYRHKGTRVPIAGATAEYESGATAKRITGTRVITGTVLAGPVGAVVGGALRKNKTKCYITITFNDGNAAIIEAPIKEESRARQFTAAVNAASAYYANRD